MKGGNCEQPLREEAAAAAVAAVALWGLGRERQTGQAFRDLVFRLGRVFRRTLLEVTVAKCWSCSLQVEQFHAGPPRAQPNHEPRDPFHNPGIIST